MYGRQLSWFICAINYDRGVRYIIDAAGRNENSLLTEFIANLHLAEGRIIQSHFYNGLFYSRFDPVFKYWFATANFL